MAGGHRLGARQRAAGCPAAVATGCGMRCWTIWNASARALPSDRIFLCANAPIRALRSGMAVSDIGLPLLPASTSRLTPGPKLGNLLQSPDIVRLVLRKAGIEDPPSRRANLIRHPTATTMLRAGAILVDSCSAAFTLPRTIHGPLPAKPSRVSRRTLRSVRVPQKRNPLSLSCRAPVCAMCASGPTRPRLC